MKNELFWNKFKNEGEMHAPSGIDYFVFNKDLWKSLPDFIIGRPGYDNWLIWKARRTFVPIIDATNSIQVIHQNHHYNFHNKNLDMNKYPKLEWDINKKLTQNKTLNILDSTYELSNEKIVKKDDNDSIIRDLHRLPYIFPEFAFPIKIFRRFYKRFFLK